VGRHPDEPISLTSSRYFSPAPKSPSVYRLRADDGLFGSRRTLAGLPVVIGPGLKSAYSRHYVKVDYFRMTDNSDGKPGTTKLTFLIC
jgi:hypothetical protein